MLYQFNVISSVAATTDAAYFDAIRSSALEALQANNINGEQAWSLCEYIDAVDSGVIPLKRLEYRQVTAALQGYMSDNRTSEEVHVMAKKSWAANTLIGLLPPPTTAEIIRLFAA